MSRNILATVKELYISIKEEPHRLTKNELYIDQEGVKEDKFYGKDPLRAVLISSIDAYNMAKQIDIDLQEGILGENILIEGSISSLHLGDRFKIGEVTFELAQNCTLCQGLSKIDSKLPKLLKDDRGIFVKALESGVIKKGDIITL
ncbi:MAG: MOSC domain-containing protein [Thiovulaceae bacterium]|nr:MOSC domain-containing protein [Sulfurimonadaceae bacterium]